MASRAVSIATGWLWPLRDALGDLRVRYGIKLGLAALLALYCAEALRLEHPNWAILTVLVMMGVRYVGSIAIIAIMQVAGAIAGALVGIWLVGDYASTPVIFLTLFFFVVAFAGYKFGQFPASQVPFAYFLVGLSTIAVTTYGVADPAQVWQIGLNRALEIVDGATSALLVTSLLWPRYAREEFLEAGRAALNTIGKLFSMHMDAYVRRKEPSAEVEQIHQAFGERLSALRNLLQVGSRESTVFRARLANYNAFLASLTDLFHHALDLSRGQVETSILSRIEYELEAVAAAISEEFDILAGPHRPGEKLRSSRLNEAFAGFEDKVSEIRDQGAFSSMPLQTKLAFYGGFAALRSLRDELNNMRYLAQGLPGLGQLGPEAKPHSDFLPTIDWFWVKIGVRGGLAAVISIFLLMWINPFGPASIPLVAFFLTVLGRPFLRAGGTGDLRSFQHSFLAALGLAACAGIFILTTSFLADYAVMNVALFLTLFTLGFLTARISGLNFWILLAYITISALVGLNPQEPVATQTIIDTFLGFITGMGIATVVGRLIWPVLPQMVMRDNLLALFAHIKGLLNGDPHREKIQTQVAILPVEALQASRQIRIAGCSEQEKARLGALIRALQTLVTRTTVLVSRRHILPEIAQAILRPRFERLEVEFKQMLDAFAECLRQGDCRRELPSLRRALGEMDGTSESILRSEILKGQQLEAPVRVLELVDHYHATGEALEECRRLISTLKIDRYWGHCGL
jgi:Fusaric acid resistance protein family